MCKTLNLILLSAFLLAFQNGCDRSQSAAPNNPNLAIVKPTAAPNTNSANKNSPPIANADAVATDDGEIKSCSPDRLYQGEILTVAFKQPHGNYAAIQRLSDKKWFFLNDAERSQPVWTLAEFKTLAEIKINPAIAVNTTNSETPEKIFAKNGKYRIMVSDQDFGQEDPMPTGICEVEYADTKRPAK